MGVALPSRVPGSERVRLPKTAGLAFIPQHGLWTNRVRKTKLGAGFQKLQEARGKGKLIGKL